MAGSVKEVNKAISNMNKGSDKKEEMRLRLAGYANWDRFLTPAPVSIALLGHLILVSADADFSLQDKDKEINFKLLKYPDSFRACLVQVSNSGWNAFNKAHTNMDQIRLYSSNVDSHVRTAVKFLLSGSSEEVSLMLPESLKSIESIADECVTLSRSVEREFVYVMDMVAELLEVCTRAKGQYEEDLKETKIAIKVVEEHKKAIETQKAQAEKKRDEMLKQMKTAENNYQEAVKSMPSTGDLIGLSVAGVFIDVARSFTNLLSFRGEQKRSSSKTAPETASTSRPKESEAIKILQHVPAIKAQTDLLLKLATGKKSEDGKVEPDWNNIKKGDQVLYAKERLQKIAENTLPASQMILRQDVEKLCTDGVKICSSLLALQKTLHRDKKEVSNAIFRAEELSDRVETMRQALEVARGGNTLPSNPPQMNKRAMREESSEDGGLVKSAMANARFKTESAKEMLKDSRENYDKSCEDLAKQMEQYGNILADLAKQDLKKIDFEKIREVLIRGIKALAELREQWGKLVQFFEMLSNLVKCSLESSLNTFVNQSRNAGKLTESGIALSDTFRDILYEQAFQANQIAYVVNSISSAYFEVSRDHLMEGITCLGKLIALDPEQDKREIQMKREELRLGCEEAQDAIKRIADRKKREIDEAFDKRIGKIEQVEALMPPMAESKIKAIKNQAQSAMAIGKAAALDEDVDDWA